MEPIIVKIVYFVYLVFILLISLSVHESAHAYIALKRGDPTGYLLGRISLNPLRHIDPIGSIVVPLILFALNFPVFGWAKPVLVNPLNFKRYKIDNALVSAAGPLSNLLLALIGTLFMSVYMVFKGSEVLFMELQEKYTIPQLILDFAVINLVLMSFNFIPIPPLDGSKVLEAFLPSGRVEIFYERFKPYGFLVLLFLIMTPILGYILTFLVRFFLELFVLTPLKIIDKLIF